MERALNKLEWAIIYVMFFGAVVLFSLLGYGLYCAATELPPSLLSPTPLGPTQHFDKDWGKCPK